MHEPHEAARAVAAVLDFAAVGVEYAVAEVGFRVGRSIHDEDLVATDPELAMSDRARTFRGHLDGLPHAVQHHEVVTGSVHFGEIPDHRAIIANLYRWQYKPTPS